MYIEQIDQSSDFPQRLSDHIRVDPLGCGLPLPPRFNTCNLEFGDTITLVQIGFGQTLSWTAYETSQCVRRLTQCPQEGRRQDFWTISDDQIWTRG